MAPGVRLLVTPESKQVVTRVANEGIYWIFLEAGTLITNPAAACAPGTAA